MIFLNMFFFPLETCCRPHSQKFGVVEPGRVGWCVLGVVFGELERLLFFSSFLSLCLKKHTAFQISHHFPRIAPAGACTVPPVYMKGSRQAMCWSSSQNPRLDFSRGTFPVPPNKRPCPFKPETEQMKLCSGRPDLLAVASSVSNVASRCYWACWLPSGLVGLISGVWAWYKPQGAPARGTPQLPRDTVTWV